MIIPDFPKYDITEDGVITHIKTGTVVKQYVIKTPHGPYMGVRLNDSQDPASIHSVLRLLALAYLPSHSPTDYAMPLDGDRMNVKLSNVSWRSRSSLGKERYVPHAARKNNCWSEQSVEMLLDVLELQDAPITMVEISSLLQEPYTVVRYTMYELIRRGKVRKVPKEGFELIRGRCLYG